jgi:hypothetical protein
MKKRVAIEMSPIQGLFDQLLFEVVFDLSPNFHPI